MKEKIIVTLFLAGISSVTNAQSLDIGGVELRVGQDIDEALKSLSFYNVSYNSDGWFVTYKTGTGYSLLGTVAAKNNKVSYVSKHFDTSNGNDSILYSNANNELNRRGGNVCLIYEKGINENSETNYIHGFEKKCGAYKLVYFIPSRMSDGQKIASSISIYVGDSKP